MSSTVSELLKELKPGAEVLDYGCFGWGVHAQAQAVGRPDIKHSGGDILKLPSTPPGATFYDIKPEDGSMRCDNDRFDLVVASHVLEHSQHPLTVFGELARICKPGGKIYIESPSDRSTRPFSSPDAEDHSCLNFWDDPTHIRPMTPAAFYRFAVSYGCRPLVCEYISPAGGKLLYPFRRLIAKLKRDGDALTGAVWDAHDWCCRAVLQKPADVTGKPEYHYITLKGIKPGADNALALYQSLKSKAR